MQIEYNDTIPAAHLKPGELGVIVEDPTSSSFVGRVVQLQGHILNVLGDATKYEPRDVKVRRIKGVVPAPEERDVFDCADMKIGQFGVVVRSGSYSIAIGAVVQKKPGGDLHIIDAADSGVTTGKTLTNRDYEVRVLPPGTKITL